MGEERVAEEVQQLEAQLLNATKLLSNENSVSDYRPETIELSLFKLGEEEAVGARATGVKVNGGK